jgi:hypothetical protein
MHGVYARFRNWRAQGISQQADGNRVNHIDEWQLANKTSDALQLAAKEARMRIPFEN